MLPREWLMGRTIPRTTSVILLCLAVLVFVLPGTVAAVAGFGDYISEKLLGDGANEALYLGDSTNELTVLGSGPIVSTGTSTSSSAGNIVSMIVHGNLSSLNGMPQADVWFRWGYAPGAMVNISAVSTVSSTGEQTAAINPNAGTTVYYQFRASTDGTSTGSVQSLAIVGGGHGVSYWFMNTLLPIVIACVILVGVLILTGNPIAAFLAGMVGVVGYYVILAIVSTL